MNQESEFWTKLKGQTEQNVEAATNFLIKYSTHLPHVPRDVYALAVNNVSMHWSQEGRTKKEIEKELKRYCLGFEIKLSDQDNKVLWVKNFDQSSFRPAIDKSMLKQIKDKNLSDSLDTLLEHNCLLFLSVEAAVELGGPGHEMYDNPEGRQRIFQHMSYNPLAHASLLDLLKTMQIVDVSYKDEDLFKIPLLTFMQALHESILTQGYLVIGVQPRHNENKCAAICLTYANLLANKYAMFELRMNVERMREHVLEFSLPETTACKKDILYPHFKEDKFSFVKNLKAKLRTLFK